MHTVARSNIPEQNVLLQDGEVRRRALWVAVGVFPGNQLIGTRAACVATLFCDGGILYRVHTRTGMQAAPYCMRKSAHLGF